MWKALLGFRATFVDPPQPAATALLGRPVTLLDQAPERTSLYQYWPDVKERDFQDVVNELVLPGGTFFDSCPIHAMTTATLERLRQLESQLDFAVERFRPNLLIRPADGAEGFVEEAWIGHTLRIGDSLVLRVDDGCPRCVVTTLAQGGVPQEIKILRATARHNKVVAGIRLSVLTPGPVALGDPVTLLDPGSEQR
ncbi:MULTISPECIES: MOSC domain-containing protein [unclassified Synechococcus]|uniref:MOSC domain-containing protein n=1 Tax=unclassified Synechococcus TaxID=2626047 RepID=UPI0020CD5380|nr:MULTISPECIES: MOSC domain-containing protein [unclassified Synechococcus]